MKKNNENRLSLDKIRIANLNKQQEDVIKGGARFTTDKPTISNLSCVYCDPPATKVA